MGMEEKVEEKHKLQFSGLAPHFKTLPFGEGGPRSGG